MARVINSNALAKLATQYGTEPVNIIQIQWTPDANRISYSDKDIPGQAYGSILEVGGLDAVIQISGGSDSQEIDVTLDDTDGSLKEIVDNVDIHNRPCWVYQWFEGLDFADKFLIFKGYINSPITWDEGDRTLSFTILSKIEDVEIGFSIEEGDFDDPPENLIGQPWPLCFGTVVNVPALKANSLRQGILGTGNGIRDFTLAKRLEAANELTCPLNFQGFRYIPTNNNYRSVIIEPVYEPDQDCLKRKCEVIESLELQFEEQGDFQFPTMVVFGGEKFPQAPNVITIAINGAKFTGTMSGETFTITQRMHPRNDGHGGVLKEDTDPVNTIQSECGSSIGDINQNFAENMAEQFPDYSDCVDGLTAVVRGLQTICANASKYSWDVYNSLEEAGFFWANAGDTVTLENDNEIVYIANILPSTVLRVAAWRELRGSRQLLTVPADYYTVRQTDYNSYDVCEVVFEKPLSTLGDGWEDDIYVSLESSVGPNTVEIMRWAIEFYTDYGIDETSFDAVESLIDNYPMHFWLRDRKNLLTFLEEVAYQARCAIFLRDDTFYIRYLATEPSSDDTMTESDVDANSLKLTHSSTDDLVTKYVAEWWKDYAFDKPNKVILGHNVNKYGTHEQVFDYYCFNIHELVVKTATFWLIRKANIWRRAEFSTPLHKLKLEVFDTLDVTLPDIGNGTFKAVVEKANYNSDSNAIDFELWTPIKSGTRVAYDFAFPADVSQKDIWPTLDERDAGDAGTGTDGPNFSVIAPNNHPLSNQTPSGVFPGFQLEGCTTVATATTPSTPCRANYGDQTPGDAGDSKPTPKVSQDQNGAINTGTAPVTTSGQVGSTFNNESKCCAEAKAAAEQARKEAAQARAEAQKARKDSGADNKEDDGGDPDDAPAVCGGTCTSRVLMRTIVPTLVVLPPGSENTFGNQSGDSGSLSDGNPATEKCYTFKTKEAANAFAKQLQEQINSNNPYGWVVGTETPWLIIDSGGSIGGPCPPDDSSGAIVGFTKRAL